MKEKKLEHLLTKKEIESFKEIYLNIYNSDKSSYQKQWDIWVSTATWVQKLERKEDFINETISQIQSDLKKAYRKIVFPYIKKGNSIIPFLGSLLGFVREKNLIKHDDDLDLAIDIFDYIKIKKKMWLTALFKGWKLHTSAWFDKNGNVKADDICARLYQMKETKYSIGDITFKVRGCIDLWPITKIPDGKGEMEIRNLYYIHMQNLYLKNNINKFFMPSKHQEYIDEKYIDYANELFNSKDSLNVTLSWLSKFINDSKNSSSNIYMPLEKEMPKIANINFEEGMYKLKLENFEYLIPNDAINYLNITYVDWKVERYSHLHFIRYHKINMKK